KDDFYGGRSHLSQVHVASRLSFNSIRLGLEEIFCCLQLPDQLFDFRNRCSSNLPNKWRDIRVSFGLRRRRRLYVNEIAVFTFGFHKTHSFPLKSKFSSRKLRWQTARGTLGFRSCDSSVLDALDFDILHVANLAPITGAGRKQLARFFRGLSSPIAPCSRRHGSVEGLRSVLDLQRP